MTALLPPGCWVLPPGPQWTASSQTSWLTMVASSGFCTQGGAVVRWTANPSPSPRSGTFIFNGTPITVTQAAAVVCTASSIAPDALAHPSAAGSQDVAVTGSPAPCAGTWQGSGNGSWITVSPAGGSVPGTATVSWTANTSGEPREGFATIGDGTFHLYQYGRPGVAFGPSQAWAGAFYGPRGTFFADVTGDGKADVIAVNDYTTVVRRSTGVGFGVNELWTENGFYGSRATAFADVTGDGLADGIVVNDYSVTVRRSTGASFAPNEPWTEGPFYGALGTFFADVTGDGRADAIAVNDGIVVVRRSTGSEFAPNEVWAYGATYVPGARFADVSGDGRADAVSDTSTGLTVQESTGSSFAMPEHWSTTSESATTVAFADVDGSGMHDWIGVKPGFVAVRIAKGRPFFADVESWTHDPFYGSVGTYFADVTGDGRADAIAVDASGITVRPVTPQ
jgi:hypothetical protein